MSSADFVQGELAAAAARGIRQFVVIGAWQQPWREAFRNGFEKTWRVFAVDEDPQHDSPATFVPTLFASEVLASALEKSDFDKRKPSLFVWLGGVGYRTVEAALAGVAFIASLPKGSGVVFDYAVERDALESPNDTALDALASRTPVDGGHVRYRIQPQAVAAMLRGLSFRHIVDRVAEGLPDSGGHLVSALV